MPELSLDVNGVRYPVAVHVEKRRTARASIGRKGVTIRLPSSLSAADRRQHAERLMAWATRRLARRPVTRYEDGQELRAAGRRYVLRIRESTGTRSSARACGAEIVLCLGKGIARAERELLVRALLARCLAREGRGWMEARVAELNRRHFRVHVGKVSLRNTVSTWGSCTRGGNLSFSTRLLLAPEEIVQYVCVHELAHRIVPNHSPSFWNLVRRVLPEYEERRRWLRRHGQELAW